MKASDLSENLLSILRHLYHYGEMPAKRLSEALEIKRTTLRNSLKRMEVFGLIDVVEGEKTNRPTYLLTDEGKLLIQRHLKAKRSEETSNTIQPTNVEIHSKISDSIKQRPDIVSWLRGMAEACNRMADEMAAP